MEICPFLALGVHDWACASHGATAFSAVRLVMARWTTEMKVES